MTSVFAWREQRSDFWKEFSTSGKVKANSTEAVQRRREEGRDNSTFHGLSVKADRQRVPHGGAYTRAVIGRPFEPDGKSGQIRLALANGPMTRKEIAEATGIPYKHISGLVKNDVQRCRIRVIQSEDRQKFALAEVA